MVMLWILVDNIKVKKEEFYSTMLWYPNSRLSLASMIGGFRDQYK